MSFRNISAWAIRNPVPPIVLFIALTLAGIVSFMRMDVNNDPDIDFPVVIVVISQPGAALEKRTTDSRVSSLTTGASTQSGTMKWRYRSFSASL